MELNQYLNELIWLEIRFAQVVKIEKDIRKLEQLDNLMINVEPKKLDRIVRKNYKNLDRRKKKFLKETMERRELLNNYMKENRVRVSWIINSPYRMI